MRQLHEVWPGRNRFLFGKCISGPASDCGPNLCWHVCATIIVVLYSALVLAKVWADATPALPIFFYLSVIVTTIFYHLTACTDPGIIPRRPILEHLSSERNRLYLYPEPDSTLRECTTCKILRPPRASHCSSCNNCV